MYKAMTSRYQHVFLKYWKMTRNREFFVGLKKNKSYRYLIKRKNFFYVLSLDHKASHRLGIKIKHLKMKFSAVYTIH